MTNEGVVVARDRAWRLLDIVLAITVGLSASIVGWQTKQISDVTREVAALRVEVARITANRFTSQDGLDVWREIAAIKEQIAAMPKEIPPAWFINEVRDIKRSLEKIEDDINEHLINHNGIKP